MDFRLTDIETSAFLVFNLTSWGYQYCQPDTKDGSYGGMLSRLLMTILPDYYPSGSAYSHFPMMVPSKMKVFLKNLRDSPVDLYTFNRPVAPASDPVTVTTYQGVNEMLDKSIFASDYEQRIAIIAKGARVDLELVGFKILRDDVYN